MAHKRDFHCVVKGVQSLSSEAEPSTHGMEKLMLSKSRLTGQRSCILGPRMSDRMVLGDTELAWLVF